ncbi:hypothetical protein O3P69_011494 [Scylla paramamosain]|uniref:Uncharacterized protein n=1 Tax=Scylla paramamosain TaxID=85552 RepID=A0AAW0T5R6_SCYPA
MAGYPQYPLGTYPPPPVPTAPPAYPPPYPQQPYTPLPPQPTTQVVVQEQRPPTVVVQGQPPPPTVVVQEKVVVGRRPAGAGLGVGVGMAMGLAAADTDHANKVRPAYWSMQHGTCKQCNACRSSTARAHKAALTCPTVLYLASTTAIFCTSQRPDGWQLCRNRHYGAISYS